MRACTSILLAALFLTLAGRAPAQDPAPASPPPLPPLLTLAPDEAGQSTLLDRVIANQKKDEAALDLYERLERLEIRKNAADPQPAQVKISRVVPVGTGTDRIPLGPDATPADPAAYRAELLKLERALAWAAEDGAAQLDAYAKIARKHKDRDALIAATRSAFLYTFVTREPRGDRLLAKFRMAPNPAYKPTSRSTAFFTKVRGFVWIDESSSQLARVEGEIASDISIGGFLAKVYRGSHFMQERYEVAPGLWLPSFSQYDFDGRKIFLPFSIHERTFFSRYHLIGPPKDALPLIRAELASPEPGRSQIPTRPESASPASVPSAPGPATAAPTTPAVSTFKPGPVAHGPPRQPHNSASDPL